MRLRSVKEPFDHPDYIFELKHDGFRAVTYVQNGECKILSRNSNQLRFKSLRENLARLPVQEAIIDGEIICIDGDGVSRFNHLLDHKHESVLYVFDLLWINGVDLRQRPLLERKKQLERLVRTSGLRLMYAQHIEKDGKDLFDEICRRDLEGLVGKKEGVDLQGRRHRVVEDQESFLFAGRGKARAVDGEVEETNGTN
jgi:bifunctional non-homologous end joining protein LigD